MPFARSITLSLLLAFWLSGCLNQESIKLIRYDAKADRFHLLAVYEHFRSSSNGLAGDAKAEEKTFTEDVAKLRAIWDTRDRLIPGYLDIGGPTLMELKPDRSGFIKEEVTPGEPPVAWDKVAIHPGKLFKDKNGLIGFWQEVELPGSVIDQVLARQRFQLSKSEDLIAELKSERASRTGKPASWEDLAKWTRARLDKIQAKEADAENEGNTDAQLKRFSQRLLACMDVPSLDAILAANSRSELGLLRKGSTLILRLPITRRDADGLIAIVRQVEEFTKPLAAPNGPSANGLAEALMLLREPLLATGHLTADDKGLELSFDAVALFNHLSKTAHEKEMKEFAADEGAKARATKMAATVTTWNDVPLAPDTDPEKIIAEFTNRPLSGK